MIDIKHTALLLHTLEVLKINCLIKQIFTKHPQSLGKLDSKQFWTETHQLAEGCSNPGIFFSFLLLIPEKGEGKEKERERNINVTEKHQSVASCTHLH